MMTNLEKRDRLVMMALKVRAARRQIEASQKESVKLSQKTILFKKNISYFFHKLMQRVLYKIDKEWDTCVVNIQEYVDIVDLVHKDYYDLLYKFLSSEYNRGKRIAENRVNRKITSMVTKSDTPVYLKPDYKTRLTGTIQSTEQSLEDLTFTASEKTLNRVKQDKISKVLIEGYRKGLNGTEVGRHIKVEFGKLKTSEAVRIARTELHSAHEKGLIDQYKSMDVQYVQWDAHIDNRTRDTHIDLDGEITSIDGRFSNGLAHPGDKKGAISEWIHCRCTLQPYLMPIGKKPPAGATYFREDDLVDADTGFDITKYTLDDALTGNWGKTEVSDYALTPAQQKRYSELLQLKEEKKLLFNDRTELRVLEERTEFQKLNEKKIKGKLSYEEEKRYNRLFDKYGVDSSFKIPTLEEYKAKNTSWRYTEEDAELLKQLNKIEQTEDNSNLADLLRDKSQFTELHKKSLNKPLSYDDSKIIIQLQRKHDWNDVTIERSQLTLFKDKKVIEGDGSFQIHSKYKLSSSQEKEIEDLAYKRLEGNLNNVEKSRLSYLYDRKRFNVLYSQNIEEQGLNWEDFKDYRRLYNKLKTELNLKEDLLDILLPNHNHNINFDEKVYYNRFSKRNSEGKLPDNERIEDWFTLDATELTPREREVADRWLGADYRLFADYFDSDKDIGKFAKKLENKYDELLEINKKAKAKGEKEPIKEHVLWDYFKYKQNPSEALDTAESIAYDWITLENILKNQTKRGMMAFRVQEEHFLGDNPKVGDVVELRDCLSTSITKDGALWFSATNDKEMKYLIEYELPTGTNGAYLAPVKKGTFLKPNSPYHGDPYAYEMEFLLNEHKVEIIEMGKRTTTGALGEKLQVIKLRIVR